MHIASPTLASMMSALTMLSSLFTRTTPYPPFTRTPRPTASRLLEAVANFPPLSAPQLSSESRTLAVLPHSRPPSSPPLPPLRSTPPQRFPMPAATRPQRSATPHGLATSPPPATVPSCPTSRTLAVTPSPASPSIALVLMTTSMLMYTRISELCHLCSYGILTSCYYIVSVTSTFVEPSGVHLTLEPTPRYITPPSIQYRYLILISRVEPSFTRVPTSRRMEARTTTPMGRPMRRHLQ